MDERSVGRRFSHVYIHIEGLLKDSPKARFRIAKLCESTFPTSKYDGRRHTTDYKKGAINRIERELGLRFASKAVSGSFHEYWEWYFNRITVSELLDSITVLADEIRSSYNRDVSRFTTEVQRIFREESLAYELDDVGGVHPVVDSAFGATKHSAIAALSSPRYAATASNVEAIDTSLKMIPPDYKAAIRSSFAATENLFKLMYSLPRLDSKSAGDRIGPDQQSLYKDSPVLQSASSKLLEGFKDWINAVHFFRHEEGVEEPTQPSEEIAILLISQGLSFVRWLAQIDRLKQT